MYSRSNQGGNTKWITQFKTVIGELEDMFEAFNQRYYWVDPHPPGHHGHARSEAVDPRLDNEFGGLEIEGWRVSP